MFEYDGSLFRQRHGARGKCAVGTGEWYVNKAFLSGFLRVCPSVPSAQDLVTLGLIFANE